jgi:hypothetical protein
MLVGCAAPPVNPSFPVTSSDADAALHLMHEHPAPLQRPLVIVGGMNDPGLGTYWARTKLANAVDDEQILGVSLMFCSTFDSSRDHIVSAVQKRFPSNDSQQTVEVDVIGISLGCAAARYAAVDQPGRPRLRIKRLFSISGPHRGATVASQWPIVSSMQKDVRPGSEFLKRLNAAPVDYAVIPYVHAEDTTVGAANAAPEGQIPIWIDTPTWQSSHAMAIFDSRFLVDIARRLRNEPPLATEPRTPLPDAQH